MAPSNKAAFDGVPGFCCNVEDTHRLVGSGIWGKDTVVGGGEVVMPLVSLRP